MPPKAAAKGGASKPATKTTTKTGAAKGGASGTKTAAKGATSKDASKTDVKKVEEEMAKVSIKKVLVPEEIGFKEVAVLLNLSGDLGQKIKDSKRWTFMIDRNGNVHTFLKYRDVNMISVTSSLDFQKEPLRKALMGALRFGKPHIIDISDADQGKALDKAREIYNEIYDGLWDDLMDRSLLDFEKCGKLYQANDDQEYHNAFDYRVSDFQFMVYTTADPPSTAMDTFFPVYID
ncbi:IQ motif and ankyrin repeat domain-containing protein 1-like [Ruditapes philippinarum]|uniref:IQ motif and ankyrin repeat domain-containing protein 1-like n=1 Tax=Ruditapes philippinarum TaxID=129788 RepID=UPI00295BF7C3|nr:IQ motif and ankyrin repeat domain-containing protein 1-like [Ruditapes philippinarum]